MGYKTQAQIAEDRYNDEAGRRIFRRENFTTSELITWLQDRGPLGNRPGYATPPRPHVIETLEYDDGSHLDVLNGAVVAW